MWAVPGLLTAPPPPPQVETPCLPREYWESLGPLEAPLQQPWSLAVLLHLGKQLAELLVQAVQMPRSLATPQGSSRLIPVLYHVYSFRSYRQVRGRTQQRDCAVLWGSATQGSTLRPSPSVLGCV